MSSRTKKSEYKTTNNNGNIPELMKELWQAAVIDLASSTNKG